MQNQYYNEYISRINRAIDYIEENIDNELSLDAIANVANFSKFHFHRIFTIFIGETLFDFIQRIRIEKAAGKLMANPNLSITELAFDVGFGNISAFSRAFKRVFGLSPTEFRSQKNCFTNENSNLSQTNGNRSKMENLAFNYFRNVDFLQNNLRNKIMFNENELTVNVKDVKDFTVAYVRYIGPYAGNSQLFEGLFGKIFSWAGARGLLAQPDFKCISVYHDDPNITEESKLRTSVCISVPEDTAVDGEIGKMTIPGGKYAIGSFKISKEEYGKAWDSMCGVWLPQSGYAPADGPCFEMYLNDPKQDPEGKHIVDIYVPVKPL